VCSNGGGYLECFDNFLQASGKLPKRTQISTQAKVLSNMSPSNSLQSDQEVTPLTKVTSSLELNSISDSETDLDGEVDEFSHPFSAVTQLGDMDSQAF
jgi:hypothetical protein